MLYNAAHATQDLRAMLKSEVLKEAFQEITDTPGAATVTIECAPTAPHFKLSSRCYKFSHMPLY
jgi:Repair protein Rad1/Rec1/Rad17